MFFHTLEEGGALKNVQKKCVMAVMKVVMEVMILHHHQHLRHNHRIQFDISELSALGSNIKARARLNRKLLAYLAVGSWAQP